LKIAYICESHRDIYGNKIYKSTRERCNDIERQNVFSNTSEKISFIFYCEMKHKWGKGSYTDECKRKERRNNMAKSRDLETKRDQEEMCQKKVSLIFGGEGRMLSTCC
jgi:hypothetical protein